jgi:formylglycine-generating enzyme required for sulfatase activity
MSPRDRTAGRPGFWALLIVSLALVAGCRAGAPRDALEFRDCASCPVMVVVPPGAFRMGFEGGEEGRPEGPVRDVTIGYRFAIGRFEVTQEQFAIFVRETGHLMRGGCQVWQGEWRYPADADWTNPGYGRVPYDDEPVVCVSWKDAQAFVTWLAGRTGKGYRLPSEAEWEYAARAGAAGDFFWGEASADGLRRACEYANVYDAAGARLNAFNWAPFDCDDGFAQAAPVGSFRANAFGLNDMVGNVWEWTADCYQAPYPAGPVNGAAAQTAGPCERRVARGGSWITRPSRQRLSFRGRDPEDALYSFFGFRVARDL